MPATVEALLIAVVFVMPGFIFVRTREWFVPPVAKSDAGRLTLTSITVSLAFVPLWLPDGGGVGVWIPAHQVVSIEIYDPPPASR